MPSNITEPATELRTLTSDEIDFVSGGRVTHVGPITVITKPGVFKLNAPGINISATSGHGSFSINAGGGSG
jgi:hypothetical protein